MTCRRPEDATRMSRSMLWGGGQKEGCCIANESKVTVVGMLSTAGAYFFKGGRATVNNSFDLLSHVTSSALEASCQTRSHCPTDTTSATPHTYACRGDPLGPQRLCSCHRRRQSCCCCLLLPPPPLMRLRTPSFDVSLKQETVTTRRRAHWETDPIRVATIIEHHRTVRCQMTTPQQTGSMLFETHINRVFIGVDSVSQDFHRRIDSWLLDIERSMTQSGVNLTAIDLILSSIVGYNSMRTLFGDAGF